MSSIRAATLLRTCARRCVANRVFSSLSVRPTAAVRWNNASRQIYYFPPARFFSTASAQEEKGAEESSGEKREFQAETKMLLDIVAKSLYSDKEVFIRELISNSNDALEKLRYLTLSQEEQKADAPQLEIRIGTDKMNRTFTIQDNGTGMTKEELIDNLGTIARSGSKAFLKELESTKGAALDSVIGQFGVGFYSAFMVADSVEVYSKSHTEGSKAYKWTSDGTGFYEISEWSEEIPHGTRIVVHLKGSEAADFADQDKVKDVIQKHSNFVCSPIYLNGDQVNTMPALWTKDPKSVDAEQHESFFKFITHQTQVRPQYTLHYRAEAPVNLSALLYVPKVKPFLTELAQDSDVGVALYSRRVLIQQHANSVLPRWLRFLKGVIDSEDIPLNLSRELLQKGALINKLKSIVTARVVKFLQEQQKKNMENYAEFHKDYAMFFKEGLILSNEQSEKEDLAKLLLFESSNRKAETMTTLNEYVSRMQESQNDIYYLCAPSRELAETSPYYEAVKEKNMEVLFAYDPPDEIALMRLEQFQGKRLMSVEKWMKSEGELPEREEPSMPRRQVTELLDFVKLTLGQKRVENVKTCNRVTSHPCLITVEDMGAARSFTKLNIGQLTQDQMVMLMRPTLEVNTGHPIVRRLNSLRSSDKELAELVVEQIYTNAMVTAGLINDPRPMVGKLNELLTKLLEPNVTEGGILTPR